VRRLFPSPALSAGLLLLWVLLMESASPGTLLLGAGLAVFWPVVTRRLMNAPFRLHHPLIAVGLVLRVVGDMLRANVAVAWAVLTRRSSRLRSGFVQIPLELRDPNGLAALAMIVTFTPGTAWAQLSADNRILLLHVLDLQDEEAVVNQIKQRYEGPLRRVFE
jgi:multicomponent K+:H+ antiporter subunit E